MDQSITPLVTVLMPVYNGGSYLQPAIESILTQTFRDFELLAIDDGSTDGSRNVLESYADTRMRLIPNEKNLGLAKTLNKGMLVARGKYLARMDCDDISLPTRLEKQVRYLQTHTKIGILGGNFKTIDGEGNIIPNEQSHLPKENALIRWWMCFGSPLAHPTVMLQTELLHRLGGYRPGIAAEDYDLWARAVWETEINNLPDFIVLRRKHGTNITTVHQKKIENSSAIIIQDTIQRTLDGNPIPLDLAQQIYSWRFKDDAQALQAAHLILALLKANLCEGSKITEKYLIRTNACRRLLRLFWQHRSLPFIFALAWRVDPLLPFSLFAHGLNRLQEKARLTFEARFHQTRG